MQQAYRVECDGQAEEESAHGCRTLLGIWPGERHTARDAVTRSSIMQTTPCFHKEGARLPGVRKSFMLLRAATRYETPSWVSHSLRPRLFRHGRARGRFQRGCIRYNATMRSFG